MNSKNHRSPFNSFRDTPVRRHDDSRTTASSRRGGRISTSKLASRDLSYSKCFSQSTEDDDTGRSVEQESMPPRTYDDDDLPLDAFGELYSVFFIEIGIR